MGTNQTFDAFGHQIHIPAEFGHFVLSTDQSLPHTCREVPCSQMTGHRAQTAEGQCDMPEEPVPRQPGGYHADDEIENKIPPLGMPTQPLINAV
jgi:hypothetical protein